MLLFFLLCAYLQTLWAKPLSAPLAPSSGLTANITSVVAPQQSSAAPDGGHQLRSVYDIVQSCLFTIFACVWTSIHPNLNGPRDSWWTRVKRRVITTFYTVMVPEIVLLWALYQRFSARKIVNKYNTEFKTFGEREMSLWEKFRQLFRPLPKSTTRRGARARQAWTTTHGFFIQMGGFVLYENEYPKEALTYDRLSELLRKGAIDAPIVTEHDLQDKSKGDTISKGIVVLQTSWFVLQCIVRMVQHLPLSELEVLTLAFAVMNGAIYAAWWQKPQGVDAAICVPLKQLENIADGSDSSPAGQLGLADGQHSDNQPLMQANEHTGEKRSWLRRMLEKDFEDHSFLVFLLVFLPYRLFGSTLHPISQMLGRDGTLEIFRMPIFYSAYQPVNAEHIAFFIGTIFGAVHILGWSLEFSLPHDHLLWQISAVVLTVVPVAMLAISALPSRGMFDVLQWIAVLLFAVSIPFYAVARFVVIVLAFKGIIHPPHNVLLDISWTRYIPHF